MTAGNHFMRCKYLHFVDDRIAPVAVTLVRGAKLPAEGILKWGLISELIRYGEIEPIENALIAVAARHIIRLTRSPSVL